MSDPKAIAAGLSGKGSAEWRAVKVAATAFGCLALFVAVVLGGFAIFLYLFGKFGPIIWVAAVVFCGLWFAAVSDVRNNDRKAKETEATQETALQEQSR